MCLPIGSPIVPLECATRTSRFRAFPNTVPGWSYPAPLTDWSQVSFRWRSPPWRAFLIDRRWEGTNVGTRIKVVSLDYIVFIQSLRQRRRAFIVLAAIMLAGGCTEIDAVNSRTSTMNEGVANYYSEAILLNVIRASRSEPLSFVALTSLQGHNTINGGVGLPAITLGPHTPVLPPAQVPARNFTFAPNTLSRSASTDFNASVVDDSASYQGLLAPISPATIGFFINQGYSRELLFFLFVDRMRLLNLDGTLIEEYTNDPVGTQDYEIKLADGRTEPSFQQINSECFQNYLAWMIREGFTAQVDVDALPAARSSPANRFCADPGLTVWFRSSTDSKYCKGILDESPRLDPYRFKPAAGRLRPMCNASTAWSVTKTDTGASKDSAAAKDSSAGSATATAAGPTSLTVSVKNKPAGKNDPTVATATTSGATPVTLAITAPNAVKPPKEATLSDPCGTPTKQKPSDPRPSYEMCLDGRIKAQIFLRSAFGVYEFLGKLIARRSTVGLYTGLDSDLFLFTITNDTNYCFVSISYSGERYCVPSTANNTKRIFALLRQLVALNSPYANQPPTLTVRTTPN